MEKSTETMRRLQIAGIGLVSVILVGALARVLVEQATDEDVIEDVAGSEPMVIEEGETRPEERDEPLAELGVTPAVEKAPAPEDAPPPGEGAR